jgi:hypothetical protein
LPSANAAVEAVQDGFFLKRTTAFELSEDIITALDGPNVLAWRKQGSRASAILDREGSAKATVMALAGAPTLGKAWLRT